MAETKPLVCPSCAISYSLEERFCPRCGMPLTYGGAHDAGPASERHARARKVKPQYTEGALVRVAGARNQPEAELIQGMLLDAGVPSLIRRSAGFDVPDFLAAGPRDVLVPASGVIAAREALLTAELDDALVMPIAGPRPLRLLAAILLIAAVGAAVLYAGTHL